jgi:hypothetical protein
MRKAVFVLALLCLSLFAVPPAASAGVLRYASRFNAREAASKATYPVRHPVRSAKAMASASTRLVKFIF